MKSLIDLIKRILYGYDIEIAEIESILSKVMMGIAALVGLLSTKDISLIILANKANIPLLSIIMIFTGILHTIGLAKYKVNYRRLASFIACIAWFFITFSIGFNHMVSYATLTFALSSALVYLRLTGILSGATKYETYLGLAKPLSASNAIRTPGLYNRTSKE